MAAGSSRRCVTSVASPPSANATAAAPAVAIGTSSMAAAGRDEPRRGAGGADHHAREDTHGEEEPEPPRRAVRERDDTELHEAQRVGELQQEAAGSESWSGVAAAADAFDALDWLVAMEGRLPWEALPLRQRMGSRSAWHIDGRADDRHEEAVLKIPGVASSGRCKSCWKNAGRAACSAASPGAAFLRVTATRGRRARGRACVSARARAYPRCAELRRSRNISRAQLRPTEQTCRGDGDQCRAAQGHRPGSRRWEANLSALHSKYARSDTESPHRVHARPERRTARRAPRQWRPAERA